MSWIFGYFGKTERQSISSPENPLYHFKDSNLILFAGGNKQTCFFQSDTKDSCWLLVGVGLKLFENGYKLLSESEWSKYLSADKVNLKTVNGHFVAVKYANNELRFFPDELGLREIFIVKNDGGFGFTTRIDWLKYFIKPEIDLKEFGSRWLLQNQISHNSIIKNVTRLIRSNAVIRENSLITKQNEWEPNFEMPGNKEIFNSVLQQLISIAGKKISLSLSGGLDSRLLLSYLTQKKSELWETHTFGDPEHPDSKISRILLKDLNLRNRIIDDNLPATDKLIELIKDYSVQSIVTNPASSILNLRFYDRLADKDRIVIDGGFGEIWRRAFANRLMILGRKHLIQKDAVRVTEFLNYYKADIFSDDALLEMRKGCINQLEDLFQNLPDPSQIGVAEWLDLFSVRCRLANYYAPEQARIDNFVISFMPLVQKDILNLLFGITNTDKKNGKLFKQLIWRNSIQLTKIPLVKGNITHHFSSSSLSARLQSRIKNKLGFSFQSKRIIEFQNTLKEFIIDVLKSAEVRNYKYYDPKKLGGLENKFLKCSGVYNYEVDWFLSFELFRRGIADGN